MFQVSTIHTFLITTKKLKSFIRLMRNRYFVCEYPISSTFKAQTLRQIFVKFQTSKTYMEQTINL